MSLKGLTGGIYRPLSQKQIRIIHDSALEILEKIGVAYDPGIDEIIALLEKSGARVNRKKARITFPRQLIAAQAEKAPAQVVLYSRDGRNDLDLTGHKVYMGTGGAAVRILDLDTGRPRPTSLNDLYQVGRLVDRLENIHFLLRPCIPTDIPESAYDVNMFYSCLKATQKHVMSGVSDESGVRRAVDMASIIAGGAEKLKQKPFISMIAAFCISPLRLSTHSIRILKAAVQSGIPVVLAAAPMSGSTSPVTMAGTLAQLHAEQLAGISICQSIRPGAPLLYGGIPGMADMNTMGYRGGAVECGMMNAAVHQLAHYIKVPNYNSCGLSDSKLPDTQAGWEKAMTTLLAAMGGSNYVHHAAGMLESMLCIAYEQYVIDNEIIGMSCKVLKGMEVDEEHLALNVIEAVGPGGNFITTRHTLDHMRREYFLGSGITDSKSRDQWEAEGGKDTRQRARELARSILKKKEVSYIPEAFDRRIRQKFEILL